MMSHKKISKIILILILGWIIIQGGLFQTKLTFLIENAEHQEIPEYIKEFVKKNPQAKELITNYQVNATDHVIHLKLTPDKIPLFIQWDKRWAYERYGKEIIGTAGCGPTCLAMVATYLTGEEKYNPRFVAQFSQNNNYLEGSKTRWTLMYQGCKQLGLKAHDVPLDKKYMIKQLHQGQPIICSVRPGDFTTTGHFIVITKYQDDGFYLNDPNSYENSSKKWTFNQLAPQIKAMWSYEKI